MREQEAVTDGGYLRDVLITGLGERPFMAINF